MAKIIFKIKSINNIKCWWGCWKTETFVHHWQEFKMVQPHCKIVWQFPIKLNMHLPYHTANALLGIYPREIKHMFTQKIYTQMFTAALFMIGNHWKQHKCPPVCEWVNTNTLYHAEWKKKLIPKGHILYNFILSYGRAYGMDITINT